MIGSNCTDFILLLIGFLIGFFIRPRKKIGVSGLVVRHLVITTITTYLVYYITGNIGWLIVHVLMSSTVTICAEVSIVSKISRADYVTIAFFISIISAMGFSSSGTGNLNVLVGLVLGFVAACFKAKDIDRMVAKIIKE